MHTDGSAGSTPVLIQRDYFALVFTAMQQGSIHPSCVCWLLGSRAWSDFPICGNPVLSSVSSSLHLSDVLLSFSVAEDNFPSACLCSY